VADSRPSSTTAPGNDNLQCKNIQSEVDKCQLPRYNAQKEDDHQFMTIKLGQVNVNVSTITVAYLAQN